MKNFHVVFAESNTHFQSDSFKEIVAEIALELNVSESSLLIDPDDLDPDSHDSVRLDAENEPVARIYTEEQYQKSRS